MILLRLLILFVLFFGLYSQARPIEKIENGLKRVVELNTKFEKKGAVLSPEHVSELSNLSEEYIDFAEMAKKSFGFVWQSMKEEERKEAQTLLKRLLINSYVEKVAKARQGQIELLSESVSGDRAEVSSFVSEAGKKNKIEYRMRKSESSWRVVDVVIEGVSLVLNYRQEFNAIHKRGGIEAVLKSLREKIDSKE
ncbi:MAG: ABC transporter substrate-binding protein [Deltaproteobacteria bacterium]|nr:ABC transporter substrate-binding protein [Deltaproteobacteria bacterium]